YQLFQLITARRPAVIRFRERGSKRLSSGTAAFLLGPAARDHLAAAPPPSAEIESPSAGKRLPAGAALVELERSANSARAAPPWRRVEPREPLPMPMVVSRPRCGAARPRIERR